MNLVYNTLSKIAYSIPVGSRLVYAFCMPPKKSTSLPKKSATKATDLEASKATSVPKQTKIFTKEVVDTPPAKNKTKKFVATDGPLPTATSAGRWKVGDGKVPSKLVISCWNVNGIRAVMNKSELQNYLKKLNPDFLCINQTKIDEKAHATADIVIDNYHHYWNFCKSAPGYSGVAIFSKYNPITITEDIPDSPHHSQEGRVLTLEFEPFYLVTSYIPNAGEKLVRLDYRVKEWDVQFQKYLNQLKTKKPVIWCGDLNVCHKEIDIANPKGNLKSAGFTIEERNSFDNFLKTGWVDTFRALHPTQVKYSYWSVRSGARAKNLGWRLDYFIVPEEFFKKHVKESRINNDIMGSDHCPIQLVVEL